MASNPTMADNLPKVEPFTAEPTEAKRQSSADPQIFRSASNGLSLTGILVGRTFSAKKTVLSPPTEIRLMKPQMQQSDHEVDIASVAELKQYVTSVDQIGFSFASESCKDGTFEGNTVTGNASAENTGDVGSSERRQKITFHARVKTTVFPTAACQLNPGRLSLSKDVILELKSIANLLKEGQNCSERCEAFFNRYGSHVNAGILHFGGVNRCLATYSSETESDRDVTIRMVRDVLSAYCSQNYNFSPNSMVTADYLQSVGASCLAPYEKSELEKVSVYMQQNGGSLHMANLNYRLKDWEESLTTSSETWAVVDRGSNVGKDVLGIWDLIPNHEGDFAEPHALAAAIAREWEMGQARKGETVHDSPRQPPHSHLTSIADLVVYMRESLIPAYESKYASNTGTPAEHASDLASVVNELHMVLRSRDIHQLFFLKTVLLPLEYDCITKQFQGLLTADMLRDHAGYLERKWEEFQVHRNKGPAKFESFLFNSLITSEHFQKTDEHSFTCTVDEIRHSLSPKMKSVLDKFAKCSPFNWNQLELVTSEMIKGNSSVLEEDDDDFVFVPDIHQPNQGLSAEHSNQLQGTFSDMLDQLDLRKYYPCGISLHQAKTIRKSDEEMRLSDLPWRLLQKLLMGDYRARDQLISEVSQRSNDTATDVAPDDVLQGDLLGELCDHEVAFNPLDVLLVTFLCCDNILRQVLAEKLFVCKLAIPFLYPHGAPDKLMMSLWALRSIVVEWRDVQKETQENRVTDTPFPIVAFVRLGRPYMSKAQLMNHVLSDKAHDTFLHSDSPNGSNERQVADGLVECAWFVPSGQKSDVVPTPLLLLNLRGDGSSHQKQMDVLNNISSAVLVTVNVEDLGSTLCLCLAGIVRSADKVLLLLTSRSGRLDKRELQTVTQTCCNVVGKEKMKKVTLLSTFKKGVKKNASDIRTEVRASLGRIADSRQMPIVKAAHAAREQCTLIDEDDPNCMEAKYHADNVMRHVLGKPPDCKKDLIPLQDKTWKEICKVLKKQHRLDRLSTSSSFYGASHLRQQKTALRNKQMDGCRYLTPFIKEFIASLKHCVDKPGLALYLLCWLKMMLDDRSRTCLPILQKEYNELWAQFQRAKSMDNEDILEEHKKMVHLAEQRLIAASFGLEHMFREIGQIYEATKEGTLAIDPYTRKLVDSFPGIVAKLLEIGIPLELVDGDASSVPATWVQAVLAKLADMIGKDKRLFVISVLGIQSSGKSTLLNTIFGLQFSVGAGRCTKGVFMQLVPVDKTSGLPFDYVVVVDTEGLRSEELTQIHDHDNELATLVVGLGDVTIMNIKGENTAEIKDILQIVVHAFLRMKIVHSHLNWQQACIFIHQNVPALNAKEKMMTASQKLQENLDAMTKEAAESEKRSDIHRFCQIRNFDVREHVWHLPDLWLGDPPMAPANPGYSERVEVARSKLLLNIGNNQTTFLTTSDLSSRVDDLWKGILAEDFVFSFRNSIEVKAYNNMESKYYELEWLLQSSVTNWLQTTAEFQIMNCEHVGQLETCCRHLETELIRKVSDEATNFTDALMEYFNDCNLQKIVRQWQQTKLNAVACAAQDKLVESKKHLQRLKEVMYLELTQEREEEKYRVDIMNKATQLADDLKGKEVADDRLKKVFEDMWQKKLDEVTSIESLDATNVETDVEQILQSRYHNQGHLLLDELQRNPLGRPLGCSLFVDSIAIHQIMPSDLSLKEVVPFQRRTRAEILQQTMAARWKLLLISKKILKEISMYLEDLRSRDKMFEKSYAIQVLQILKDRLNDHSASTDAEFTILPWYGVKLAVHICRHCVHEFQAMQQDYEEKHGLKSKLEAYREVTWNIFKNTVKQSTEEVIAADLFCDQLTSVVKRTVFKKIKQDIVTKVQRDFAFSKFHLLLYILDDLATKKDFGDFMSYIHNAKLFAYKRISEYTNDLLFRQSQYKTFAHAHLGAAMEGIRTAVRVATTAANDGLNMSLQEWIRIFCSMEGETPFIEASFKHMTERGVADFANLQRVIEGRLDAIEISLKDLYSTTTDVFWDSPTPYMLIINRLWGCPEQCIFCSEPCSNSTEGHYSNNPPVNHICLQHRPKGVAGNQWTRSGELVLSTCSYSVQTAEDWYTCATGNYACHKYGKCTKPKDKSDWHKYRDYKTYLQEWDIEPDSTDSASAYWQWFMVTFGDQLQQYYRLHFEDPNIKLPKLPEAWTQVNVTEAKESLRKNN